MQATTVNMRADAIRGMYAVTMTVRCSAIRAPRIVIISVPNTIQKNARYMNAHRMYVTRAISVEGARMICTCMMQGLRTELL